MLFMNSHYFPLSLLSELKINILALEVWFCSLETSSWRLSEISSCCVQSFDFRSTPWKNWLQTEMNQIQSLTQPPEREASHHTGDGDRLGTQHIPGKYTHYKLAWKTRALHIQTYRKLMYSSSDLSLTDPVISSGSELQEPSGTL